MPTLPVVGWAVVAGVKLGINQLLNGIARRGGAPPGGGGLIQPRMGTGLDERELRRRAIEGVRDEVEAFGSGSPDSKLIRRDGLLASVSPSTPHRSLFNSIFCDGVEPLAANSRRARRSSTTPTASGRGRPGSPTATTIRRRCLPSGATSSMRRRGRWQFCSADLGPEPPRPDGVALGPHEAGTAADLNDRAYGYGPDGFRAALSEPTSIAWSFAVAEEAPVGCVGAIDVGDDCCITGVATPPEHRGRGIAGWLLWQVLEEARQRGMATASLQATKAGAPLYERLGFTDYGFVEMWELRK